MTQEIRALQRDIPFDVSTNGDGGGLSYRILQWIGYTGSHAPAYWSTARDTWLRQFYLDSDYLKIAVSTFTQKAYGVPLVIAPRVHTVSAHAALAGQIYSDLMRNSGLLKGFYSEFSKFTIDYLSQDNGGFMLVMGPGKADGPITGQVTGVMHLDAQHCVRTGDPLYPVVYHHTDGKPYKLHYTRVIFMSSMPSTDALLYDVGLCAISRCIDAAHDMLDIMHYTAEKLGSRPARQIVYAKKGATLPQLDKAILHAQSKMDSQGLEHFARTLLLAPAQGQELDLAMLDLAKTPDGFDRMQSTILDLAVIAASFGLDMRDLAHSFGVAGQTKADAEVMHMKTNDKGVQRFLTDFAEQLNQKVMPETIEAYFDYVDDTQDEQAATIRKLRAEGRTIDLTSGAITLRIAREQMLENQEITEEQFEDMELADGRLRDGLDVLMLFQSQDTEIRRILDIGIINPMADAVDAAIIDERIRLAWERHDTAPNANIKRKMRQAIAALTKLRTMQTASEPRTPPAEEEQPAEDEEESETAATKEAITPSGAGAPLPAIPDEDDIARDAEDNADEAMRGFDEANPEVAGILDATIEEVKALTQSDRFSYDPRAHNWRDKRTGRFITETNMRAFMETYQEARTEIGRNLAGRLANNEITLQQWTLQMRGEIRNTFSAEYMAGRGGRNAMTQADWGRVGSMLRGQYQFLDGFARDIAAGNLSEAQIAARANLYFGSARQAFERAKAISRGMPDLPAYPCDGSSECLSNCHCRWDISETRNEWRARWVLGAAEHCATCSDRAGMWNPLVIPKE